MAESGFTDDVHDDSDDNQAWAKRGKDEPFYL